MQDDTNKKTDPAVSRHILERFAKLCDDARASLQELREEDCDLDSPADACAFGALHMLRYFTDGEPMTPDEEAAETARILALFAAAARATALEL